MLSKFRIEEADIVCLETEGGKSSEGWVNVGCHAILIAVDCNGDLSVGAYPRTNGIVSPIESFIVRSDYCAHQGGIDPDKEL